MCDYTLVVRYVNKLTNVMSTPKALPADSAYVIQDVEPSEVAQ